MMRLSRVSSYQHDENKAAAPVHDQEIVEIQDPDVLNPSMIEKNHPLMIPRRWRGYTGGF